MDRDLRQLARSYELGLASDEAWNAALRRTGWKPIISPEDLSKIRLVVHYCRADVDDDYRCPGWEVCDYVPQNEWALDPGSEFRVYSSSYYKAQMIYSRYQAKKESCSLWAGAHEKCLAQLKEIRERDKVSRMLWGVAEAPKLKGKIKDKPPLRIVVTGTGRPVDSEGYYFDEDD